VTVPLTELAGLIDEPTDNKMRKGLPIFPGPNTDYDVPVDSTMMGSCDWENGLASTRMIERWKPVGMQWIHKRERYLGWWWASSSWRRQGPNEE